MFKLLNNKKLIVLVTIFTIIFMFSNISYVYARQTTNINEDDENILEIPDLENEVDEDESINVSVDEEDDSTTSYPSTSSLPAESSQSSSATVSSLALVPDDSLGADTIVAIVLAVVGVVLILLGIAILLKLGKR